MGQELGQILFAIPVVGLIVLVAAGTLFGAVTLVLRGLAGEEAVVPDHPERLYHHPDPIQTPVYETLFMLFAMGLLAVGLPAALAAIFYFVVPLVGQAWGN